MQDLCMKSKTIYDLSVRSNRGELVELSRFRGRPMLLVNTASKCGFTSQYDGLQALHEAYGDRGLVVIGFPSRQFAQELADDAAVEEFCRLHHGVTFPLTTLVDVNGAATDPVLAFVKERSGGLLGTRIPWNFTKFLVAGDGITVRRYSPRTPPAGLVADIEALLGVDAVA